MGWNLRRVRHDSGRSMITTQLWRAHLLGLQLTIDIHE